MKMSGTRLCKPHICFVRTGNDLGVWMCRNVNGWPRIQRFGESPKAAYRDWLAAFIKTVPVTQ